LAQLGNQNCLGLKHPKEHGQNISRAKRLHHLPLDQIASRYLAGEELSEVLKSFPQVSYRNPEEAIRRQLIRDGFASKTRKGKSRGAKNFQWKGGRTSPVHYYRRQSYEIAAICQGKPLEMGEIIHHDDEVAQNNAPENLLIFRSAADHLRFHQRLLKFQLARIAVDSIQLAIENGARRLQRPASLTGWKPDITLQPLLEKMDRRIAGQQSLPAISQLESHLR